MNKIQPIPKSYCKRLSQYHRMTFARNSGVPIYKIRPFFAPLGSKLCQMTHYQHQQLRTLVKVIPEDRYSSNGRTNHPRVGCWIVTSITNRLELYHLAMDAAIQRHPLYIQRLVPTYNGFKQVYVYYPIILHRTALRTKRIKMYLIQPLIW